MAVRWTLAGNVTTIAGDGAGASLDGLGIAAQFNGPGGITTDGVSLFVIEVGGNRVRKIDNATSNVTTVAGSAFGFMDGTGDVALFTSPRGITTDGVSLFVGDQGNQRIRRVR